jgi:hypothetical protein
MWAGWRQRGWIQIAGASRTVGRLQVAAVWCWALRVVPVPSVSSAGRIIDASWSDVSHIHVSARFMAERLLRASVARASERVACTSLYRHSQHDCGVDSLHATTGFMAYQLLATHSTYRTGLVQVPQHTITIGAHPGSQLATIQSQVRLAQPFGRVLSCTVELENKIYHQ